jgi:hypothetical protein
MTACSAWRCPRWASSGHDRVGVQEGRARCGRNCSAAAVGGSAREQRDPAWKTSEAVKENAAEGTALRRADHGPRGGGGAVMARRAGRKGGEAKAEVRAELDWRVRGCERECSAGGRLSSIQQARACARQQATREQVMGQWCESRTGTVCRRCDRARRSCRRLRGCADRVSTAHAREQWRFSP